jgi:hypothetical protein
MVRKKLGRIFHLVKKSCEEKTKSKIFSLVNSICILHLRMFSQGQNFQKKISPNFFLVLVFSGREIFSSS